MPLHKPTGDETAELIASLIGADVDCGSGDAAHDSPAFAVGWYKGDDEEPLAFCSIELGLLAHVVGALAMFPKDRVQEVIDSKSLDAGFSETANEVFNVIGQLFNRAEGHVRLDGVELITQAGPPNGMDLSSADVASYAASFGDTNGTISFVLMGGD